MTVVQPSEQSIEQRRRSTDPAYHRFVGRLPLAAGVTALAAVTHAVFATGGYRRFMLAYLTAFAFVLSLSLGALFFVLIQHLTRAGWSVLVRRPAEAAAATLPLLAVLFLPIAASVVIGSGEIYPWAQPSPVAHDPHAAHAAPAGHGTTDSHAAAADRGPTGYEHQRLDGLTLSKRAWLNPSFFLVRCAFYLGVWALLGSAFWRQSLRQDRSDHPGPTMAMERLAGPAALAFGLTVMFASFDLLMSLNPHWYSTIFGAYYFSGCAVGGFAVLILLVLGLQCRGVLPKTVGEPHYLDLGRLLFAFTFFWAYVAFSQYMLLWYANLPESTGWLRIRGMTTIGQDLNGWTAVILLLLAGHFLIPFAGLMSRHIKRRPTLLAFWAGWLLLMHYLDLLWVVMPEFGPHVTLGLIEVGLGAALTLLWLSSVLRRLSAHAPAPANDPRLHESIRLETAY